MTPPPKLQVLKKIPRLEAATVISINFIPVTATPLQRLLFTVYVLIFVGRSDVDTGGTSLFLSNQITVKQEVCLVGCNPLDKQHLMPFMAMETN